MGSRRPSSSWSTASSTESWRARTCATSWPCSWNYACRPKCRRSRACGTAGMTRNSTGREAYSPERPSANPRDSRSARGQARGDCRAVWRGAQGRGRRPAGKGQGQQGAGEASRPRAGPSLFRRRRHLRLHQPRQEGPRRRPLRPRARRPSPPRASTLLVTASPARPEFACGAGALACPPQPESRSRGRLRHTNLAIPWAASVASRQLIRQAARPARARAGDTSRARPRPSPGPRPDRRPR